MVKNRAPYITENRGLTADRYEEILRAQDEIDKAIKAGEVFWGRPRSSL